MTRWHRRFSILANVLIASSAVVGAGTVAFVLLGISGVGQACFPGVGCLVSDGVNVCVDSNLNGIACEAGERNLTGYPTASTGQSVVLAEGTSLGTSTVTVDVGATNLASSVLYGFAADGSLDFPASAQLSELGGTPATPTTSKGKLYMSPQGTGYQAAQLKLLDDLGYVYSIAIRDGVATANGIPRWFENVTGSALLTSGNDLTYNGQDLDITPSGGNDYVKLDAQNAAALPTAGDCDNAAEVGRLVAKSGANVGNGTSGLCVCAVDNSSATPEWRCFGIE